LSADFTPRRKFIQSLAVGAAAAPAAEDVQGLEVLQFRTNMANPGQPVIWVESVQGALVESYSVAGNSVLLEVKGVVNNDFTLQLNRVSSGAGEFDFMDGATDAAISRRG
jgi:hypothetical protein